MRILIQSRPFFIYYDIVKYLVDELKVNICIRGRCRFEGCNYNKAPAAIIPDCTLDQRVVDRFLLSDTYYVFYNVVYNNYLLKPRKSAKRRQSQMRPSFLN